MFVLVYVPDPFQYGAALMKMWGEQAALVQSAQAQFALMLITPWLNAVRRDQMLSKMQRLHLEVVTNPATVFSHRSQANLSLVDPKRN